MPAAQPARRCARHSGYAVPDPGRIVAASKIIRLGGRGFDCNLFLLKDATSNAYDLVDAGIGTDHGRIMAEVAAVIDPHRIRTVAITHEHLDHVNGIPQWQTLGASIATSRPTADKLLAGHDPTSAMFGHDIPALEVDQVLEDEQDLQLGGDTYRALWTPGHSPGSMCYWHAGSGTLFSGDTVFAQGGIGRFDFPDGDVRVLAESVLRLERLPVQALHCGHGPSIDGEACARSLRGSAANVQACL